jgi:DegV family protein with EDD domain
VLSGTYQNASAALEKVTFKEHQVILDSLSVSAGTGVIALELAEAIDQNMSFAELTQLADETVEKTEIFIALKTLDAVQKGGRLSVGKKRIIDFLGLNLVLSITKDGFLKPCGVTFGRRNIFKKFEKFVLKKARGKSIKRIGVVHGVNPDTAESLKAVFQSAYPDAQVFVSDFCPALGVHGGVGAIGIALQYN